MKQKYAIGFITFMLATVLAACVHDYPAMTPDGEGRHRPHACRGQYRSDPRPRTPTTGNHHQQGTPRNHKSPCRRTNGLPPPLHHRSMARRQTGSPASDRHGQCRRSRQRENHAPCPFEAVRRRIHPRRMDGLRCGRHDHRPLL